MARDSSSRAPARCRRTPASSRPRRRRRCSRPLSRISRAGGAVDLGGPVERLGVSSRAPTAMTMKSCTSTRRPAWAPPPKIWISRQRQHRVRAAAPRDSATAARRRRRRRRAPRPSTPRRARCRRAGALFGRAVERDQRASTASWSAASRPASAARDLAARPRRPRRARRGRRTRRRRRAGRRASPAAGRGAGRRDGAADARRRRASTSTSTVGRPRESQTRRPWTAAADRGHVMPGRSLRPGVAHRRERVGGLRRSGRADARGRASLSPSRGDVLDRRLAVDPGEQQARQQPGGARLEPRPAAPSRRPPDRRRPSASKQARNAPRGAPASTGTSAAGG